MAVQVFPDQNKLGQLDVGIPSILYYWLFTNDITPDDDSVTTDFAAPASTVGVDVANTDFTVSSLVAHVARRTAPDIGVPNNSGSPISAYGYFATNGIAGGVSPSGSCCLALRFDDAPRTVADGDAIAVTPTLALGVC